METSEIPPDGPSNWQPITNKHDLAVIGKLGEEACELGSALFRCVIQGIDEAEPTTGKVNRQWVEEEVADVLALVDTIVTRFDLDIQRIMQRRQKKFFYKKPWFDALKVDELLK